MAEFYWFVLLGASLSLLFHRILSALKEVASSNWNSRSKSLQIGTWSSLKITICMLLYPKMPNYEMADLELRKQSRSSLMLSIPTRRENLLIVKNLTLAKRIMSSSRWLDRFRHDYYLYHCTWNKPYGMLFGSGEYARQSRILSLRILHQLNFFGGERLERLIHREVAEVLDQINGRIEANGGSEATFSSHQMFEVHTLNIISQFGWSERCNETSYMIKEVMAATNKLNRSFNVGFGVLEVFPCLSKFPGLTFYGDWKRGTEITIEYFQKIVNERRRKGTYRTAPADFTDYWLQEIHKGESPEFISDKNYCVTMRDLVWAGTDSTNSTLEHGILHMALHPAIQKTVQSEIDRVLGRCRAPSYVDRAGMPYTQAVLLEIFRYATPVPLTSRSCPADTKILNEHVPKGSLCGINIYSIHRSEELWEDPSEFRPERFLGPDGEIVHADKILPFGFGKHSCIGESVGRTFLFIAFVSLMQRYNFQLSSRHPPPSLKNVPGISRCPIPYFVTVTRRTH